MRMILGLSALFIFSVALFIPSIAYEASYTVSSYEVDAAPPRMSARAWGVFDTETGQLISGRAVTSVRPIASVTKLMTAHVALDLLSLDATTTISARAVATEGRLGRLKTGEVLSIRELLFPLLLESSNDAAEAIAEYGNRDAFLARMNATARELGLAATVFGDPSGLSPANVSTVADMAQFVEYLAHNQQYILDISSLPEYVGTAHTWHNVDTISEVETFHGGKHGYTDEADRTLAAIFEETASSGDTRKFTIVLLGSDDLQADVETLRAFVRGHVAYREAEEPSAALDFLGQRI